MRQKFVIVTMQRSGSNMLGSILDDHPEVACFGELMRRTPQWMREQGYRGALRTLEKVDPVFKDDEVRVARPYDFVEQVYQTARDKRIQGFKLHTGQHPDFLLQLVRDPEYQVILLRRENVLAQYSSWLIAQETGQGNAPKGTDIKRARVEFNPDHFRNYLDRVQRDWGWVDEALCSAGCPTHRVGYTELGCRDRIADLISFLGADASIVPDAGTEKRNPSNIVDRFTNPEVVHETLQDIGHDDWAVEQFGMPAGKRVQEGA